MTFGIFGKLKWYNESVWGNRKKIYQQLVEVNDHLEVILRLLKKSLNVEKHIMADLAELTTSVAENTDVVLSAIALLDSLADQLAAAATDPVAVAELAAQIRTNSAALAAAVVENTPAAPPVEEPPAEG